GGVAWFPYGHNINLKAFFTNINSKPATGDSYNYNQYRCSGSCTSTELLNLRRDDRSLLVVLSRVRENPAHCAPARPLARSVVSCRS
ncbi:MAG TPA: hypothetical protein VGC79_06210, partial [Polyangiaceae bacterium]